MLADFGLWILRGQADRRRRVAAFLAEQGFTADQIEAACWHQERIAKSDPAVTGARLAAMLEGGDVAAAVKAAQAWQGRNAPAAEPGAQDRADNARQRAESAEADPSIDRQLDAAWAYQAILKGETDRAGVQRALGISPSAAVKLVRLGAEQVGHPRPDVAAKLLCEGRVTDHAILRIGDERGGKFQHRRGADRYARLVEEFGPAPESAGGELTSVATKV